MIGPGVPPQEQPDLSSLAGTLPPAFAAALAGLQPPEMENTQVTLPQVLTSALLATLGGTLADNPEIAAQGTAGPFLRAEAAKERNVKRQDVFEKQKQSIVSAGAAASTREELQRMRDEAAAARSQDTQAAIAERTQAQIDAANERAKAANELKEISLRIQEGALEDRKARTEIQDRLAGVEELVRMQQMRESEARTKNLSERDTQEFRASARDYVAQAVSAIRNTPIDQDVKWTLILPDRDEELAGEQEIYYTVMQYIDATLRGSPGYDQVRKEADQALRDAIGTRGPRKSQRAE